MENGSGVKLPVKATTFHFLMEVLFLVCLQRAGTEVHQLERLYREAGGEYCIRHVSNLLLGLKEERRRRREGEEERRRRRMGLFACRVMIYLRGLFYCTQTSPKL